MTVPFARENIKTLRDLVYTGAERFGDDPFFRTRTKKEFIDKSFAQFKHDADALGAWMEELSDKTLHASVFGLTSYEFLICWFGAVVSGNVSVPINAGNEAADLADEINRSDSEIVFLDERREACVEELKKLCPQVKHFVHMHSPYPWPGIKTIAAGCSLSRSTVKRALNDLKKAGLVEKSSRWRDNGSLTFNLYRIK